MTDRTGRFIRLFDGPNSASTWSLFVIVSRSLKLLEFYYVVHGGHTNSVHCSGLRQPFTPIGSPEDAECPIISSRSGRADFKPRILLSSLSNVRRTPPSLPI